MQCPYCDFEDTKVIDSRLSENKDAVRRRRECLSCGERFTTYERREPLRLMVLKRTGESEPFEREKFKAGLVKACAKRQVPEEEIEYIVDEVEAELRERRRHEVASRRLGDMALVRLRRLDMVAYLRFASVYRQYTDVDQFQSELVRLSGAVGAPAPEKPAAGKGGQ
ncbi:transcriptional regulator NrdR [Rubrobacter aplysinae]|uniref:transcriptional regulator NrdR n=1 Tax=Rubrobacter aplysinae TaxID=909625 RepID=UPI00064BD3A8|nr:transcriptional regulator NrdR [Rubrobacter aplysinae]